MTNSRPIHRIGVLTGGGDCPGLNAVIRSIVKTVYHRNNETEVIGIEDGFGGLVQGRMRVLQEDDVRGLLPRGGTILGTTNRDNPFRYTIRSGDTIETKDMSNTVMQHLQQWAMDVLIVIGGDGSLRIAHELSQKGASVIGVPKTIDNDLQATDLTFGFDTAIQTATEALDKLHTTAESHHRVMVLEVMGRYAGWIALHAGLAGGADVILIPEIPYRYDKMFEKIKERQRQGKHFSIVVAAEGAKEEGGQYVVRQVITESADPLRLGGIGNVIAHEIEKGTGMESRVTVLGHLQRGGTPTPFDRILASRFGVKAAMLAMSGDTNKMVSLQGQDVTAVSLANAIEGIRNVPLEHGLLSAAKSIGISFGD